MGLTRVKGMELQPNCCTICGGNPIDDDGDQREAIFAEGVDIDWGNSLYICWDCANIIASLVGRATKEGFDRLEVENEELQDKYDKLLEEHEEQQELVDKIRAGAKARKNLTAAR